MPIPRQVFIDADKNTMEKIIAILKDDPEHAYSTTDLMKRLYPDLGSAKSGAADFITTYQAVSYISDLLNRMVDDKKLDKKVIDGFPYYMLAEG